MVCVSSHLSSACLLCVPSDLKGQAKFLGMVGFVGSFVWGELLRFMASQQRYDTLQAKVKPDDHDGVPFLTMEWLKRFRNIFTWLCTRSMMRHEKGLLFRGRASLLVLPQAKVLVVPVQLTPTQRAAYKVSKRELHSCDPLLSVAVSACPDCRVCCCVCVPQLIHEFAAKRFQLFKDQGDAVRKTIEVLQLLVPIRQACSIATVDISAVKQQLRDLARGIAVGGPAMGAAIAPSESFPQALNPAFGSLKDECTICLELLEDAVQTACGHLFCKECILALCENKGADAACALCRQSISPARLFAPLVILSEEEIAAAEEAEARKKAAAKAAEEAALAKDADKEAAMGDDEDERAASSSSAAAAAASSSSSAAAAAASSVKKRKGPIHLKKKAKTRNDDEEDWDGERKSEAEADDDEEADGADADGAESSAAAAAAPDVDPESLEGEIEFDSKLNALLDQLDMMKEDDPSAKALVFTQFRGTMDGIQKALIAKGVKFQMLLGHYTLSQRKKALEQFKSDPDTTVFLLSVRAAAAGLTLTSASYVFIVEPGFNPAITLQAINRVWRVRTNTNQHAPRRHSGGSVHEDTHSHLSLLCSSLVSVLCVVCLSDGPAETSQRALPCL